MLSELDNFYEKRDDPNRSCLLGLRDIILSYNVEVEKAWKYKLPFFTYKGKNLCYLWIDKVTKQPYVGINKGSKIEHPALYKGDRKTVKLLYVDPSIDIPVETIYEIFDLLKPLYK